MFKLCCGTFNKTMKKDKKPEYQVLLLGTDESGKMHLIEKLIALQDQFTHQNRVDRIPYIKRHILESMTNILRTIDTFSSFIELKQPENQWRIEYILTTAQKVDYDYPPEFFEHIAILWADPTVKMYFKPHEKYENVDSTKYFFDRVNQIKEADYIPTDQDMIYSRFFQSNIYEIFFEFKYMRYRFIEVDLLQEDRRKWLHCFNDVSAIIFVVGCSNFVKEYARETYYIHLAESYEKFMSLMTNNWLRTKPVILFLNKQDELVKNIKYVTSVEVYFYERTRRIPLVKSGESNLTNDQKVTRVKFLISREFLKISESYGMDNHRCYLHFISDDDLRSIHYIFNDCYNIIRQKNLH